MRTLQTQPAIETSYIIKLHKRNVLFIWSSTPENPLKNSIDLKAKINFSELLSFAEYLGCLIQENKIYLPNFDLYNRMIIYACVRSTLRSLEKVRKLRECVIELNSWDSLYWASKFREEWWSHSNFRGLTNAARAFKLFFNID